MREMCGMFLRNAASNQRSFRELDGATTRSDLCESLVSSPIWITKKLASLKAGKQKRAWIADVIQGRWELPRRSGRVTHS